MKKLLLLFFLGSFINISDGQTSLFSTKFFKFVKKNNQIPLLGDRNLMVESYLNAYDEVKVKISLHSEIEEGKFQSTVLLLTDKTEFSVTGPQYWSEVEKIEITVAIPDQAFEGEEEQVYQSNVQPIQQNHGVSTQVNPDGTHTTIFHNGSTSTQVNPDGTQSTTFHNGNTSTQVNPNGTQSTTFHNGSTSTKVNPDGTHTTIFHNGSTSTQVNPDGTHTTIFNNAPPPAPNRVNQSYRKPTRNEVVEKERLFNTIEFTLTEEMKNEIFHSKGLAFKLQFEQQSIYFGLRKRHVKKLTRSHR